MIVAIATTAAPPATTMMGRLTRLEFEFTTHTPFHITAHAVRANRLRCRMPPRVKHPRQHRRCDRPSQRLGIDRTDRVVVVIGSGNPVFEVVAVPDRDTPR